ISPIQPAWVPPNCKFEVNDASNHGRFKLCDSFDYVHSRNLAQSIGNWEKYMSEVFRCTKPGGPFQTPGKLKDENAGFVDIQLVHFKQPLGPWAKDMYMKRVGAITMLMAETGFEAYGMAAMTRILGMSKEDATEVFTDALKGVRNKNYHIYNFL
ncbi:hypothetical protein BDD12DRAFT_765176, partial [Trichophaea hybrida]